MKALLYVVFYAMETLDLEVTSFSETSQGAIHEAELELTPR
jgi:hypothetical protein